MVLTPPLTETLSSRIMWRRPTTTSATLLEEVGTEKGFLKISKSVSEVIV